MGIPRRKFRIPGGGKSDGTGTVCKSFQFGFAPRREFGLDTVAESVVVTVRADHTSHGLLIRAILGSRVSIPSCPAVQDESGKWVQWCADRETWIAAEPGTAKLQPCETLGMVRLSRTELKRRGLRKDKVVYEAQSRAYQARGPRERLERFIRLLQDSGVMLRPAEFRRADVPYGLTVLDKPKQPLPHKPKAHPPRTGETPAGVHYDPSCRMPSPTIAPG